MHHLQAERVGVCLSAIAILFHCHHRIVTVTLILLDGLLCILAPLEVLPDMFITLGCLHHIVTEASQREVRAMLERVLHLQAQLSG